MKNLLNLSIVLICLFFIGCAGPGDKNLGNYSKSKTIMARLTFYTNHEDKFGSKIAMSNHIRAKQGLTVAAHPKFQFGLPIKIPALKGILNDTGKFEVQDRGSDVTKMKASRGQYFVFDIYLQAKNRRQGQRKIQEFSSKINPITEIQILN